MNEEVLRGGNSSTVVRIGNKVHRNVGPWTPTIHKLLSYLREQGINEVPEPFGFDEQGREVLSFIEGDVGNYPLPDWLWSHNLLYESFALMRRVHDATNIAEFKNAIWQHPIHEPQEVICHNDFAPYNMVFKDDHVVGMIDFDTASPGPRIHDFSYLAYRLIPFGEDAGEGAPSMDARMERLASAIKSYGMNFTIREVLFTMATRLKDLAESSDEQSKRTGQLELAEHAAMYRRDAERVQVLANGQ